MTHPSGARIRISSADGSTGKGTTPFHGRLPEGTLRLSLILPGYNTLTEEVDLSRNRSLDVWLDKKGQLLHKLGSFKTGTAPKQIAFTPDGREMWVTDLDSAGVEVFDAHTFRRKGVIKMGKGGAVEVIFTRDGSKAYVSQMTTASVYEIDTATRKVLRHMSTGGTWSKVMALSPDERTLYVSNWVSDNVSDIDLTTGRVRRIFKTVDTPRGLYATPDGKRLYVAGFQDGAIERIDLTTGRSKVLVKTGGAMRHLVGDPIRGLLYADDMSKNVVFVVDLKTDRVRTLAKTDDTPNSMDLSPDGKVLYVSNRGKDNPISYYLIGPQWGSILAIDTATGKYLDAIVGGNQPTGLDVSPDGTLLAYSDFLDNRLTVYAIPSYEVLASGNGGRYLAHLADLDK